MKLSFDLLPLTAVLPPAHGGLFAAKWRKICALWKIVLY